MLARRLMDSSGGQGLFIGSITNLEGSENQDLYYSRDGVNWQFLAIPGTAQGDFVVSSAGGMFFVPGYYSYDGIHWQSGQIPGYPYIAYGNGVFVTSGGPSYAMYSTNGITWNTIGIDAGGPVVYGNGVFVMLGNLSSSTDVQAIYSTNGIDWNVTNLPAPAGTDSGDPGDYTGLCYGGGKFVCILDTINTDSGSYSSLTSTDGINWTMGGNLPEGNEWNTLAYGNGTFVVGSAQYVGATGYGLGYSTDGVSWVGSYSTYEIGGIAFGNGKFVAVSADPAFSDAGMTYTLYSTNGITWQQSNFYEVFNALAFGGN